MHAPHQWCPGLLLEPQVAGRTPSFLFFSQILVKDHGQRAAQAAQWPDTSHSYPFLSSLLVLPGCPSWGVLHSPFP